MSKKLGGRIASVLMVFILILTSITPAFADTSTEKTDKWDGSIIEISSEKDLKTLAEHCHEDGWSRGKTVKLTSDITLKDGDFTYIPYFNGTFLGGGHAVRNYEYEGNGFVVGFFRYIGPEGVVKNLDIYGTIVSNDDDEAVGGFCGVNGGVIAKCSFRGNVSGKTQTGGIAGINDVNGVIRDSACSGRIKGYYYTGGIAGENRGIIKASHNLSNVNDDSEWVEENDSIGLDILTKIASNEIAVKVESGTDTGGIAGYSTGVVADSINEGTVGYAHTGYNIGGICGRSAGVILSCTNNGKVFGRKDIGGVAGQQEPDIKMNKTGTLTKEVDKLYDLIEILLDDIQAANLGLNSETDSLKSGADAAVRSAGKITDIATDYVNENTAVVNSVAERADYVMDGLPAVLDELKASFDTAADANRDIEKMTADIGEATENFDRDYSAVSHDMSEIAKDLNDMTAATANISKQLSKIYDQIDTAYNRLQKDLNEMHSIITEEDGTLKVGITEEEIKRLGELLKDIYNIKLPTKDSPEAKSIERSIAVIDSSNEHLALYTGYLENDSNVMEKDSVLYINIITADVQTISDDAESVFRHLSGAAENMNNILVYINALEDISFSYLGDDFSDEADNLAGQLTGITESLKSIADSGSQYGTVIDEDLKAVNKQVNVIYNIVASKVDELEISESDSLKDYYKDTAESELDNIVTGRMDHCVNNGIIEGDINIGGVAGAMSVDTDDQEENAAGSLSFRLNYEYTTACLINGCKNYGKVTSKKDGAGGIVGYISMGTVRSCESYGWIGSTDGSFVGGIAGESTGTILNCYSLCRLEGNKNVGGIAGYALTLKNCCSMVDLLEAKARYGAIAGQIAVEKDNTSVWAGVVSGNCYVSDEVYGIDNIGYDEAAKKITYKELLLKPDLPEDFRHLKVIFMIENEVYAEEEFEYGADASVVTFPEFPEKNGCYGVWGDITRKKIKSNIYVEGEYHDIISTLPAESTVDITDGLINVKRILAYTEGNFTENTLFTAKVAYDESLGSPVEDKAFVVYTVELGELELANSETFPVRIYNPYKKVSVYELKNGAWQEVDSLNRGGYIQVTMAGHSGTYAVVDEELHIPVWVYYACGAAAALLLLFVAVRIAISVRKRRISRKNRQKNS